VGINAAFKSAWTFGKLVGDLQHLKARTHQLDAAPMEALRRSYGISTSLFYNYEDKYEHIS
jgi:hypothetical protein